MPSLHILIKGKVQGVYFRVSAKEVAEEAHCTGWVKNTGQGHVEAMVTGEPAALDRFVGWCRTGPPGAVVRDMIVEPVEEVAFKGFSILRD